MHIVPRRRRWSRLSEEVLHRAATTFEIFLGWSECQVCGVDLGRRELLGTWLGVDFCARCWQAPYARWRAEHPDGGTIPGRPPHGFKIRSIDRISRAA